MKVHEALRTIFTLASNKDQAHNINDIKNILIGSRANTVYKAAFGRDLKKAETEKAFDFLANELLAYMVSPAKKLGAFDDWHHKVCENFVKILNSCSSRSKKYGKGQKACNMAAKYLYCCDDTLSSGEQRKFDYFHIALDGYTYIGNVKQYPLSFYRDVVICWKYPKGAPCSIIKSWAGLDYPCYKNVVDDIREFFDNHKHTFNEYLKACHSDGLFLGINFVSDQDDRILTPFEAEFFLWEICKQNKRSVLRVLF